jgi:hypothetical protein
LDRGDKQRKKGGGLGGGGACVAAMHPVLLPLSLGVHNGHVPASYGL